MTAETLITLSIIPAALGLIACGEARAFGLFYGWTPGQRFWRCVDACIVAAATMQLGGMLWLLT